MRGSTELLTHQGVPPISGVSFFLLPRRGCCSALALCHKPPALDLIALRSRNYVCARCQNGNRGLKRKVKSKDESFIVNERRAVTTILRKQLTRTNRQANHAPSLRKLGLRVGAAYTQTGVLAKGRAKDSATGRFAN